MPLSCTRERSGCLLRNNEPEQSHVGKGGVAWGELAGKTASRESEQAVSGHSVPDALGGGWTDARLRGAPSQLATLLSCRDLGPPCMVHGRRAWVARCYLGMQAPPLISCIGTRFRTGSPRTHVAVASRRPRPSAEQKVYSPRIPWPPHLERTRRAVRGQRWPPEAPCPLRPVREGSGH